ncbi:replication protein [Brevibacillus porteri]|uniref:replication protein n=1 Tax=Brevibacillus porteri TaxID=2126350 RepID=UPI003D1A745E
MSIYRVKKDSNYVVLNNTGLRDPQLSWKAKGLLAYMLSMPDDWQFYDEELETHAKDGRDSLKSAIKELRMSGYFKRVPKQGEGGRLAGWETVVFETPQPVDSNDRLPENPLDGKAVRRENRQTENPKLLSIDSTKYLLKQSTKSNSSSYSEEFERFWLAYPRKIGKKEAFKNWNTRLKAKVDPETLIQAAKNYAEACKQRGTAPEYIMHASTFLGTNDKYVDYIPTAEENQPPVGKDSSADEPQPSNYEPLI